MRKCKFLLLTLAILSLSFAENSFAVDPLLQQGSLTYMGAFRVPHSNGTGCAGFWGGGYTVAYNPAGNGGAGSLFMVGQNVTTTGCQQIAEISIPTPVCLNGSGNSVSCTGYTMPATPTTNLSNLNTASFLQSFVDDTYGNQPNVASPPYSTNGFVNYGLLIYNGNLIGATKLYYDASSKQRYSHFTNSTNLSTNNFLGYYQLNTGLFAGFAPGQMCTIPSAYQSQLGGTALTGAEFMSIITGNSKGPCAIAFDPGTLVPGNLPPATVPASALSYYPTSPCHHLPNDPCSGDEPANPYTSTADFINGVVFPDSTGSIMFFGRHGLSSIDGYGCYGTGVSTLEQAYNYYIQGTATGSCAVKDTVTQAVTGATATVSGLSTPANGPLAVTAISGTADATDTWTDSNTGATFAPTSTPVFSCPGGAGTCSPADRVYFNATFPYCYDPINLNEGNHAYPYVNYVWAYDAGDSSGNNTSGNTTPSQNATNPGNNNYTAVKLGLINPYDVVPYATYSYPLPTGLAVKALSNGAAWDPVHRLIYVTQPGADVSGSQYFPVVHVFQISGAPSPPPLAPPTGVRLLQ